MNIRPATATDEAALRALWEEFEAEVPEPEGFEPETWERLLEPSCSANIAAGAVFVAEDDDGAGRDGSRRRVADAGRWHVETVHVRTRARRQGVAKALLHACARGRPRRRRDASLARRARLERARARRSGGGSASSRSSS